MAGYEDCIVFLLAKAYQKAHGSLKRRLQALGLTPIQTLILEALREQDGLSARQIGRRLVLDSATLSGVLDRMAEAGWIVKKADSRDKRSLRVCLTARAKSLEGRLAGAREEANEEVLRGLSLEEKVVLKRLLRDLR